MSHWKNRQKVGVTQSFTYMASWATLIDATENLTASKSEIVILLCWSPSPCQQSKNCVDEHNIENLGRHTTGKCEGIQKCIGSVAPYSMRDCMFRKARARAACNILEKIWTPALGLDVKLALFKACVDNLLQDGNIGCHPQLRRQNVRRWDHNYIKALQFTSRCKKKYIEELLRRVKLSTMKCVGIYGDLRFRHMNLSQFSLRNSCKCNRT